MFIVGFFVFFILVRFLVDVVSSKISEVETGHPFFGDAIIALNGSLVQHPNVSTLLLMGSFYFTAFYCLNKGGSRI
jgi:hypothetical protein